MGTVTRVTALGLLAGAGVALGAGGRSAFAQTGDVIRVGGSPQETFAEAYYADAAGFLKQSGLRVEMVSLPTSGAMGAAVAGGSIDIALSNPVAIANARARGLPFAMFAGSALYSSAEPLALLMVAQNGTLRTAKDLEGKTIATIEVQGIQQASIRSWMSKRGADPANVRFVETSFSSMAAAVESGRVDAAMIAEPALTTARATTRVLGDPYSAIAPEWLSTVWFTTQDRLTKNAAQVRAFADVMTKTARWANTHHAETAAVIQKLMALPDDVVNKMGRVRFSDRLTVGLVQPILDTAAKYGILKDPVDAATLFAPGFS